MNKTALYAILNEIHEKSFSIRDDFVSIELAQALFEESLIFEKKGLFKPAAIGRDNPKIVSDVRSDVIAWLSPEDAGPAGREYLKMMDVLKGKFNEKYFMGLDSYECHFAKYAEGSFYREHMDVKVGVSTRKISTVLYLNPDWKASDGGTLRLYNPERAKDLLQGILPTMGRFVTFLSDEIPHEVTESNRERRSLTGWFHKRKS